MHSGSHTVPGDIRATLVRLFAYVGGLALLAIAAASAFEPPQGLTALAPTPQPEWTAVSRPHPAFELVMPELARLDFDYAIFRRNADGARKDVMTWGHVITLQKPATTTPAGVSSAGAGEPFMQIEVYRPGPAGEHFLDAASEIADRITAFRISQDVTAAGPLATKFSDVSLVEFAISGDRGPQRCLGFARPFDAPPMLLDGWLCSAGDEPVDRPTLACALDRLTLLSAGGDATLAGAFAKAEIKRSFCGQRSPILAATPERDVPVPIPHSVKLNRAANLHRHSAQR